MLEPNGKESAVSSFGSVSTPEEPSLKLILMEYGMELSKN